MSRARRGIMGQNRGRLSALVRKESCLAGTLILAGMVMPGPLILSAHAQTSSTSVDGVVAADDQPEVATGALTERATADEGESGDIVVTARKRRERLQDVPVAVTSLSAAQLEEEGISGNEDLLGRVPNLFLTGSYAVNTELRLTMRGVGVNSPLDPSVAIFIDGVYMPTVGWNMSFLELERVEVLRGPQGAVFGRNTQAGAVNIITRQPESEFGGRVRLEYDEFDTVRGNLYVTGPLGDHAAFSVAGMAEQTDGFLRNVTTGRDELARRTYAGRVALRFTPTERLTIRLSADATAARGGFFPGGQPAETQANFTGRWEVPTDQSSYERLDIWGGSATVDYDLDFATLTSIAGYRHTQSLSLADIDYINTPNRDGQGPQNIPPSVIGHGFPPVSGNYIVIGREQALLSEELRLVSTGTGPLKWLVGLYAYSEDNDRNREQRIPDSFLFANPGNFVSDATQQRRKGYAAFGQATYTIGGRLDVTAGARYTWDRDRQDLRLRFIVGGGVLQNNFTDSPEASFSDFTPMGSIAYRWTPGVMTYVTVARGFKSGGFNLQGPSAISGNAGFDSETSTLYEAGAKLALFNNRLRFDAAIFQIDTSNLQVNQTVAVGPILTNSTTNAGRARSRGFELEATARPVRGLLLTGSLGHTDAKYIDYQVTPTFSLSGFRVEQVPDWTVNLGAEVTLPVAEDIEVVLGGSWRYVGEQVLPSGANGTVPIPLDSYDTTNIRASLQSDRWEATFYVENLFNQYNIIYRSLLSTFYNTPGTTNVVRAEAPRRIGVRGSVRF